MTDHVNALMNAVKSPRLDTGSGRRLTHPDTFQLFDREQTVLPCRDLRYLPIPGRR